jgi:transcriptional regulator with XRE-family HTH domain
MLSKNLKRLLRERGLTQKELAERAGISRAAVCQYLSGVNAPSPERLKTIAEILGCDVTELTGVKPKTPPVSPMPEKSPPKPQTVSLTKAAALCGKSARFLAEWIKSGDCPFGHAQKMGAKYSYFIPVERFEKYLKGEI